jgi:histidine triad (HIT) family protein
MASVFTRIIQKELPAHVVAETKDFLAFLDLQPVQMGHTLVIPKKEVDYLFELDDETYIGLNLFAKSVAQALLQAVPAKRISTAVIGLEVPHAHIHLIPVNAMSDLDWGSRRQATAEELAELAERIKSCL